MCVAHSLRELSARLGCKDVVVACGVFDGVHRGHQRIISRLKTLAHRNAAHPVVVTFDPHPRAVLFPDEPPQYLMTGEQKIRLLREFGVEGVVVLPFSRTMADMLPWEFLHNQLLQQGPCLRGICVGKDWRFGRGSQSGDVTLLREAGRKYHFDVDAVPPFVWYRYPISSTRIRKAVGARRLEHAARMLGRPHTVRGTVISGSAQAGDELSCPTANLADPLVMLPPQGVYAARIYLEPDGARGDSSCDGIVYVGDAPTFAAENGAARRETRVEVHIFGFAGNLYGRVLEFEFKGFIRSSLRFTNPAALREQIRRDIAVAKTC